MKNENTKKEIINYYNSCEANYKRWWDLEHSLAMHAGFWDEKTKTLSDALLRENEILANIAQIKKDEYVLDAGCGVGGSSLYLASQLGANVTGITLSEKQVITAKKKASKIQNLVTPPKFFVMDYINTTFPNESFDVVWALESVCHAENKREFISEARRILKPNGRLILADGFAMKNDYAEWERKLLNKAVNGWAVKSLESSSNFEKYLGEFNFKTLLVKDATFYVLPSSKRLFYYSFPALLWSYLGEFLGWSSRVQTNDFKSYHYQYRALKRKLCHYVIFYAQKM
jgi:tocopherol O-methyltransferase